MSSFQRTYPNYTQQAQQETAEAGGSSGVAFDPTPRVNPSQGANANGTLSETPINVPRMVGRTSGRPLDEPDGYPGRAGKVTGVIGTAHWFDAKTVGTDPLKQWLKAVGPCKNGCGVNAEDLVIPKNCPKNQNVTYLQDGSKSVTFLEK